MVIAHPYISYSGAAVRRVSHPPRVQARDTSPLPFNELVNCSDVRMGQRRQHFSFLLKSSNTLRVRAKFSGKLLMATSRFNLLSLARNTSPIPPAPKRAVITYDPSDEPTEIPMHPRGDNTYAKEVVSRQGLHREQKFSTLIDAVPVMAIGCASDGSQ